MLVYIPEKSKYLRKRQPTNIDNVPNFKLNNIRLIHSNITAYSANNTRLVLLNARLLYCAWVRETKQIVP